MARNQSPLINHSQYWALRLASAGMHMFSPERNMKSASTLASAIYRFDLRGARKRTTDNIRRAMPELPEAEVQRIAETSLIHLLRFGVEVLYTTRLIRPDTWADRIGFDGLDEALDIILSDQPTILVTGHYGNWEVLGYLMAMLGIDLAAVARPIDNPLINDWVLGVRERFGLKIITKWGATEPMVDVMRRGGTLAFIGDQNAGDKGMFVPFFGRLASAYKSIALLALHHDAHIVCGYTRRRGSGFGFDIGATDIIRPEDWKDQPDPIYYITARYTRALETMVRQVPEQYWWVHRRWKSRPRFERQGKSIPRVLRKQLASLPWMDTSAIEALEAPAAAR